MVLKNEIPNFSVNIALLKNVVLPALATLVPAAAIGAFKWAQDHTSTQRVAVLTERISTLAKQIAELPELPLTGATHPVTPKSALIVELESSLSELATIQARATRRHHRWQMTTAAKIRATFLLYRPRGLAAWTLHIIFFAYSLALAMALYVVLWAKLLVSASDFYLFVILFGMLGTPPLILRYFAAKIHAR